MISVQFTIAGAPYENIKVRLEGEDMASVMNHMNDVSGRARSLFDTYEHLVQVRDMGHQEAVEAVVQGLGAVVIEEASDEGHALAEDPSQPFWDQKPNPLAEVFADKKPWERKQSSPEPAAPAAGQSVNLL